MEKDISEKLADARYILVNRYKHTADEVGAAKEFVKETLIWHDDPEARKVARELIDLTGGGTVKYVLDLFCGAGGCSDGYARGGYEVIGIDINPMPDYVHGQGHFIQADALEVLLTLVACGVWMSDDGRIMRLEDIVAVHASPPCQGYSATQRMNPGIEYPLLIEPVRDALRVLGKPYIIENVETAPLYATVTLCGGMFPEQELKVYRHRIFETNFAVPQPVHNPHLAKQTKMGRVPEEGEFVQAIGHFPAIGYTRKAMGISWMKRDELAESVPPAYTHYISKYIPNN